MICQITSGLFRARPGTSDWTPSSVEPCPCYEDPIPKPGTMFQEDRSGGFWFDDQMIECSLVS